MTAKRKARPYHHGDLRESLVMAATEMIEDGGVDAFTLRECARRAGVSHAAPKNHFATAEDLLAEVAARGFERFVATLDAAASTQSTPEEKLMAMGRAYVAFARANPGVYSLMFRNTRQLWMSEHLVTASTAAWTQLHEMVMAVTGEPREATKVKAAHVWSLVHGIASLLIDGRLQGGDPEDVIAQSVATIPAALKIIGSA